MGRTSSLGIEGVCARLAQLYGRSLDLDEVVEEMQHDKGFRKKEVELRTVSIRESKGFFDGVKAKESMQIQSPEKSEEQYSNEEG